MVLEVSSINFTQQPSSLSFSGSGFLATYQLGVAQCFLQNAPWIVQTAPSILGASAGSLVAASVACELNLITMRDEMLYFAKKMKGFTLGPFSPSVNVLHWLKYVLHKHLPPDAHLLASGRLAVALTRLDNGEHTIITEYRSKDDVIQALLCSCFVPGYCGMLPPSFNGVYYMDGGFSGMQPVLSLPSHTLTVSPFSGETDVCPADTPCMWDMVVTGLTLKGNVANGLRFFNALYPLKVETVEQAYHSGYKDAIHFLLSNQFVSNIAMKNFSQELDSYRRTITSTFPEAVSEEEEDVDEEIETTTLASFQVPVSNVMSYRSMLGPFAGYVIYFLLPIMLLFQALIETEERVELLFRQTPALALWTWYSLRQLASFFFGILFGTFKKNLKDMVLPFMLTLQLLKQQSEDEVLHKQSVDTGHKELSCPAHSESVKCGSLRSSPPLRGL
ncbi:patatin-like phospholipase domain-containing protein 2 [Dunckerocampus dactyliophorus]|uniref:patatin-like phospholipase domain-containing protein 2 n=1 Tax=Dunckerocampus dactyliophorus TaxID=161453 RepID=UPI002405E79F|nr:patatin-like phospholipase domain-containing protein 2 [Dunckerocampus dactyliophorus]